MLLTRIRLFTSLPLAKLDRLALKKTLTTSAAAIVSNLGRALTRGVRRHCTATRRHRRIGHDGRAHGRGNDGIALLANSLATGCALFVIILVFAPISGAQFNPLVI
jgi:glycerol uptake facilitator-like aquaporin